MQCEQCGAELNEADKICPECGYSVGKVVILTPEDREKFQGVTIEDPGRNGERRDHYTYDYNDPQNEDYVREFKFDIGKGGLLGRIVGGLLIAGLLFLAFPMLFFFLGVLVLGGIFSFLLRHR